MKWLEKDLELFLQYNEIIQKQIQKNIKEIAPGKTQNSELDSPYNPVQQQNLESLNVRITYNAYARKNFLDIL